MTTAVHIKQEGGAAGQSSKYVPPSSPGRQGTCSSSIGGSLAQLKTMERLKADHSGTSNNNGGGGTSCADVPDTPLTRFGKGGKPNTATAFATASSSSSSLSGQRAASNSGGGSSGSGNSNHHPLLTSATVASGATTCKSEGQSSSGQQASAQIATGTGKTSHGHVRTKGPVTRSTTVRASSPSTCGDTLSPVVSSSPPSSTLSASSEKTAKSAEKPHGGGGGLSSEEARKLRQAQQKLQKEQWMKKYGQGTKRTLEMRSGGAGDGSSSNGDDGRPVPPPTNSDTGAGAEAMENGVLISDGKMNLVKGRHKLQHKCRFSIPVHCTLCMCFSLTVLLPKTGATCVCSMCRWDA